MIACPSELDWIFLEIGTLPCSSGRQKGSCVPLVSEDAELHAKSGKGLKGNCFVAFRDQGLSAKEAPKRLHSLGTRVQCRQCKPFLFVNQ